MFCPSTGATVRRLPFASFLRIGHSGERTCSPYSKWDFEAFLWSSVTNNAIKVHITNHNKDDKLLLKIHRIVARPSDSERLKSRDLKVTPYRSLDL